MVLETMRKGKSLGSGASCECCIVVARAELTSGQMEIEKLKPREGY